MNPLVAHAQSAPLVSVLVPAYQEEHTLERAVRSALQQTLSDLEVLVLDDGSTDGTVAVARELAERDPRVRVLPSTCNIGPAATRNRGLDAARGAWVALLDADDAWLPSRLEHLLAASADVDIICDDVLLLDADGLTRGKVIGVRVLPWLGLRLDEPRLLRLQEFIRYDFGYLKPVLRRRAVEVCGLRYWPHIGVGEDFAFAVLALAYGLTWRQLPDAYYCYRRGDASLSSGPTVVAEEQSRIVPILLAVPQIAECPRAVRALRRHGRRALAALAYQDMRSLVQDRALGKLLATVLRRPDTVPLLVAKLGRRGWLAGRRRLLHADRLSQHTVEAVRDVWGLVGPAA